MRRPADLDSDVCTPWQLDVILAEVESRIQSRVSDLRLIQSRLSAKVDELSAQMHAHRRFTNAFAHGTVRLAIEAALSTCYVAVALWESTKQGAFYYAVHVLHYRGIIDASGFPHLPLVPPKTGIEALEIAIDLMRRRVSGPVTLPRGYLLHIQQEMAPYVSASPFRTHMDSTLHLLFADGSVSDLAAREISFQRFLAIAEYELERHREDGIPLPLDWHLICSYFQRIHAFPVQRASELMHPAQIDRLVLCNHDTAYPLTAVYDAYA